MTKEERVGKLFQPGKMGEMVLRNRIVMVPLNLNYTDYPYRISGRYINALQERARGGVGLIVTTSTKAESTIDPYPIGKMFPSLDRDYNLRYFAELADAVHILGAKIAVQLSPGTGRNADTPTSDNWPASPSPVPMAFHPQLTTRELNLDEIARLVEAYGEAAGRAERAGFDAIMVHCNFGYLIDQFLTSLWNKRIDKYGGSLENRMRFMVECIQSAKSKVSSSFTFIARLNSDHKLPGGRPLDETIKIAQRLQELGISALELSTGCYDNIDWTAPPMYSPEGLGVPYAQPIKKELNIPVIVEGRIVSPEVAEQILQEGKADFVGLGRALLADPWWPRKVKEGKSSEIRRCIFCSECGAASPKLKYIKCSVNPALGYEKEYRIIPAEKSKKVVVVGGGPAGMQAAAVAALRGHEVTLYERSNRLGGNLLAASVPDFKATIRPLIERLKNEVRKAGVKVHLEQEIDPTTLARLKPEVVIFAAGSSPVIPEVPGASSKNVATAVSVLLGEEKVGKRVIVIGGGDVGCEVALYLNNVGKEVTIVARHEVGVGLGKAEKLVILRLLKESNVYLLPNQQLQEITPDGVKTVDTEGRVQALEADTIVLALGMKPNAAHFEEIEQRVPEAYIVGDARQPRRIINAIHEGDFVAREI